MIIRSKDNAIITCSLSLARMLELGNQEILRMGLSDIMSEKSLIEIKEKKISDLTQDQHIEELQLISKDKNLVKCEANLLPFELSNREYLIIRCKTADELSQGNRVNSFHF